MFQASERLPHLLPPPAYFSQSHYLQEVREVFSHSWHFVGLKSDLARPGDFLTTDICGYPIQVRNIAGTLYALSNVCAHRHCLLTSLRKGNSPKLRCQYHGWEYAGTGETNRIPLAQHFAPLDRESTRISAYRVETAGQLVFVNLNAAARDLKACLGDGLKDLERGFGEGWVPMFSREFTQPVNWKIPIENSLEAYHVPAIHPETFRADPGEERSEHFLGDYGSWFRTTLPFAPHSRVDEWFQKIEGRVLKSLIGCEPTCQYQQQHLFPNLLCSFTDMVSLLHIVQPVGPRECRSTIYQFGRIGKSFLSRQFCRLWGYHAANITMTILREDFKLYPDIQKGLEASQNPGMLGRCEERIHHFQGWMQTRSAGKDSSVDSGNPHNVDVNYANGCTQTPCNHCVSRTMAES